MDWNLWPRALACSFMRFNKRIEHFEIKRTYINLCLHKNCRCKRKHNVSYGFSRGNRRFWDSAKVFHRDANAVICQSHKEYQWMQEVPNCRGSGHCSTAIKTISIQLTREKRAKESGIFYFYTILLFSLWGWKLQIAKISSFPSLIYIYKVDLFCLPA